jgi:membrane fusion protein (multidrug efflux system)
MSIEETNANTNGNTNGNGKRRMLLIAVVAAFALAGIGYAAHWALVGRYNVATDNAYVGGNVVQVTPQVAGTVIGLGADDTQFVKAGQILVELDRSDARLALEQAEATLAKSVRDVRTLFSSTSQQQSNVDIRKSDLAKASEDLARRERLSDSGAISKEEVQHAREAVKSAQSAVAAAEQQLASNRAMVEGTTVETHPDVQKAAAIVRDAYLAYARTAVLAPVSGVVAKRSVQLGQRVSPGAPVMAIVPLGDVWVDANFKEAQIADLRVGQPATLTADVYGSDVVYHGRVVGFGAGTGGAFSLLPAQNATGNWIKIVQRVPVRIALDPSELATHPLQVGLSMEAKIDIHDRGGARLPQVPATAFKTDVYEHLDELADARVKEIVAANGSGSAHAATRPVSSNRSAMPLTQRVALKR